MPPVDDASSEGEDIWDYTYAPGEADSAEDEEGDLRIINIRDVKIEDEESRSNSSFDTDSPTSDPPSTPNQETKPMSQPQPKHKDGQASRK
jgi:hypothetical protein